LFMRLYGLNKGCAIQGSNSDTAAHNQELTTRDSQGDSQTASAPADTELKRVIDAWQKLPINLRSAIVAIVDLKCPVNGISGEAARNTIGSFLD
jgi:hypothetical protein